jgi:4a-hydroxytetrahydrobiopterin dehydratase
LSRPELLDDSVVAAWLANRPTWRLESGHLRRHVRTSNYPSAVAILEAQVTTAESLHHHPIVTVGYNTLVFDVWTHDRDGITQLDLDYVDALESMLAGEFADVIATT